MYNTIQYNVQFNIELMISALESVDCGQNYEGGIFKYWDGRLLESRTKPELGVTRVYFAFSS